MMPKKNKSKSRSGTYIPDADRKRDKIQVRFDEACQKAWSTVQRPGETDGATGRRLILEEFARIQRKKR